MKYTYVTVDLEEWYELEYLKEYNLHNTDIQVIPKIIDFLDMLDEFQVKATFFIVAKIAGNNADIIREIVRRGHAIGCHGFNHQLLYEKSNDQYFDEIIRAKQLIELVARCKVIGYRASCFSMERDKLELTKKAGFRYDSSKILFKQHPLYRDLNLSGFNQIDDLVYADGNFSEYEIPTVEIGKYSIPISGGGYLRLLPFFLIKLLIRMYEKKHHNFLVYVHPFELTSTKLPLPKELNIKDKFRCLVGRKNNLRKMKKIIRYLTDSESEFRTLDYDVAQRTKDIHPEEKGA